MSSYFSSISDAVEKTCEIVEIHGKGKAVKATEDLPEEGLLWAEKPLMGCMVREFEGEEGRRDVVCEACGYYCGTLQLQLKVLGGGLSVDQVAAVFEEGTEEEVEALLFTPALPGLSRADCLLTHEKPQVERLHQNTQPLVFCSKRCSQGWRLVLGEMSSSPHFSAFEKIAKEEDLEYLILAARLLKTEKLLPSESPLSSALSHLAGDEYWKCSLPEEGQDLKSYRKSCESVIKKTCELLRNSDKELKDVEEKDLSLLVGKICRNAILITYTSPVFEYLVGVEPLFCKENLSEEERGQLDGVRALLRPLRKESAQAGGEEEEEEGEEEEEERMDIDLGDGLVISSDSIPPFRGWAVFPLLATVNHDCAPNLEVEFTHGDCTLQVATSREIKKGEELSISYVDSSLPREERQKGLEPYGFACTCVQCDKGRKKQKIKQQAVQAAKKQRNN